MQDVVIGIDLGGTNIKAGAVTNDGRVLLRDREPTPTPSVPAAVVEAIARVVGRCVAQFQQQGQRVAGLGVGSPGTIDLDRGIVLFSPNLTGWGDVPLKAMTEEKLGLPCALENDANAAALGEQWVGAGRGADSLVMFTLGTGIGGGIVLDDKVWHGTGGFAGEIGHMSINPDGPLCGCGNRGCIEAYASATAMVRRMREAIERGQKSTLAHKGGQFSSRDIYQAALAGDAAARENFEATARYLGVAVSNILHILNPAVIVLSGGVTASGDLLMEPLKDEMKRRTMEAPYRDARICFAELGEDAGFIGAARCFINR